MNELRTPNVREFIIIIESTAGVNNVYRIAPTWASQSRYRLNHCGAFGEIITPLNELNNEVPTQD